MTRLALGATSLLFLLGCQVSMDLERPITLVPGPGWTDAQQQLIRDAAQCWNLELGTFLETSASRTDPQQVPVIKSDFLCAFANGITTSVGGMEIQICSLDASEPKHFTAVTLHEIGHVLNIRDHALEPMSIMSPEGQDVKRFSAEDRELFHSANPGFIGRSGCDVVRTIGGSLSRPTLVEHRDEGLFAIWAEEGRIKISRLDPSTATIGVAASVIKEIKTEEYAGWIRAIPSADGFSLTWSEKVKLYRADVRLPLGKVGEKVSLETDSFNFDEEVIDVSVAELGTDLYVAVTEGELFPQLRLFRLDTTSGGRRPFQLYELEDSWGHLKAAGSSLLLALRDKGGVKVLQLSEDGGIIDTLQLAPWSGRSNFDSFDVHKVSGGLLVAHRYRGDPVQLYRVESDLGGLIVRKAAELELPAASGYSLVSIVEMADGTLAVAVSRAEQLVDETYYALLDPSSLALARSWSRVSPPDLTPSIQPLLAVHNGKLVVIWRDVIDMQEKIEVRGRCLASP